MPTSEVSDEECVVLTGPVCQTYPQRWQPRIRWAGRRGRIAIANDDGTPTPRIATWGPLQGECD